MNTITLDQPFSTILYKRRASHHPRLYLKEKYNYRYSRIFLTRLGFAGVTIAGIMAFVFLYSLSSLF